MNDISIEELIKNENWESDEKVILHFTPRSNIESIHKKGLQPDIGKNSQCSGKERYPRVYFSKGLIPTLEEFNHCIVNTKKVLTYLSKENLIDKEDGHVRRYEYLRNDLKELGCDIPLINELVKYSEGEIEELAYKIIYNDYKNMVYLKLDLKGCTKEEYNLNPDKYKDVDYFEDEINDEMDTPVEHRNMQTRNFHGISNSKIKLVRGNANDVISSMYFKYKEIYPERPLCEIIPGMEYNEKDMIPNFLDYTYKQRIDDVFVDSLKNMVNNESVVNGDKDQSDMPINEKEKFDTTFIK